MARSRLVLSERDGARTVQWRRLAIADILALVGLPMAAAWGIASALGLEQLDDMKVLSMSPWAAAIYWLVVAAAASHFLFNRTSVLTITPERLTYTVGKLPGRSQVVERTDALSCSIETREDPIAESDAAGRAATETTLSIGIFGGPRIAIDDLSEADAQRLKQLIEGDA